MERQEFELLKGMTIRLNRKYSMMVEQIGDLKECLEMLNAFIMKIEGDQKKLVDKKVK